MSMIGKVSGIPVFYNIEDAKSFGVTYGLTNTHQHVYNGRIGYMPGSNHNHAMNVIKGNASADFEEEILDNWGEEIDEKPQESWPAIANISSLDLNDALDSTFTPSRSTSGY